MRKHRIDMNLIHDSNPDVFFKHVRLFVEQLEDPDHLNLFLSGLKNEDIAQTMYVDHFRRFAPMTRPEILK